ncbi:hypothetical protein GHK03_10885 [Sinorhizobium medicae]|nr:hypothetical protein [Sinorhizobium medicae]
MRSGEKRKFSRPLHVSFDQIRLEEKNIQQIKVLQRPLASDKTHGAADDNVFRSGRA